jgi:hypothetical protein
VSDNDQRFWPFKPRFTLVGVAIILVVVLSAVAALRTIFNWPSAQSENVLVIGVLVLSLLPVVLALMDIIIERGAIVEYGNVKIDFSRSEATATTGITVAPNIGVPGQPVSDSGTTQILETLRSATASELVVIDLEEGQAWWETRLLVLLAGAVRLQKPDKIVFLGTDATKKGHFEGWAYAAELLPCLISADPQYRTSMYAVWAAARQWELVEPLDAPGPPPPPPPWLTGRLAQSYSWMAFNGATGLPNELFAEQVLASDLGQKIEMLQGPPRTITLTRLEELFRTVLNTENIDLAWPAERQLRAFLEYKTAFIAITDHGRYSALVSRAALSNEVLRSLVGRADKK